MATENEKLVSVVDVQLDAPEGALPAKLHLVLNRETIENAEQYKSALMVSRRIPFNLSAIPISDPLALLVASQYQLSGNDAVSHAMSWYAEWAAEAEREAYTLALLTDNHFVTEPTPYEAQKAPPPGIPFTPHPNRNLLLPVERRLKQIIDYLNTSPDFEARAMAAINDAFAEAARFAVKDVAGFQSGRPDPDVSGKDESSS